MHFQGKTDSKIESSKFKTNFNKSKNSKFEIQSLNYFAFIFYLTFN